MFQFFKENVYLKINYNTTTKSYQLQSVNLDAKELLKDP